MSFPKKTVCAFPQFKRLIVRSDISAHFLEDFIPSNFFQWHPTAWSPGWYFQIEAKLWGVEDHLLQCTAVFTNMHCNYHNLWIRFSRVLQSHATKKKIASILSLVPRSCLQTSAFSPVLPLLHSVVLVNGGDASKVLGGPVRVENEAWMQDVAREYSISFIWGLRYQIDLWWCFTPINHFNARLHCP